MAGKLGRLKPYTPEQKKRMYASAFLRPAELPATPTVVDYVSKVSDWPMYGNDQLGDCTCAAAGHMIEAWTDYGQGKTVKISDNDVLKAYEAVSGYREGHPETDQGAVMQDVLDYWRKTGIGGHKILAFAQLDLSNADEIKAALYLFGHVYLGINFPAIAMEQFDEGKPWDAVKRDGGIEGGHAIDMGYAETGKNHKVITWAKVQEMTPAFFEKYVEEAWVVVSQEWINAVGKNPAGLDTGALNAAFSEVTDGEPGPFPDAPQPDPNPQPQPTPSPAPTPTPEPPAPADADQALAVAFDAWKAAKGL